MQVYDHSEYDKQRVYALELTLAGFLALNNTDMPKMRVAERLLSGLTDLQLKVLGSWP